eukprot:s1454_g14.t1
MSRGCWFVLKLCWLFLLLPRAATATNVTTSTTTSDLDQQLNPSPLGKHGSRPVATGSHGACAADVTLVLCDAETRNAADARIAAEALLSFGNRNGSQLLNEPWCYFWEGAEQAFVPPRSWFPLFSLGSGVLTSPEKERSLE